MTETRKLWYLLIEKGTTRSETYCGIDVEEGWVIEDLVNEIKKKPSSATFTFTDWRVWTFISPPTLDSIQNGPKDPCWLQDYMRKLNTNIVELQRYERTAQAFKKLPEDHLHVIIEIGMVMRTSFCMGRIAAAEHLSLSFE